MANRYFTVDGKTLISSDFPNLTRGFDRVQKDVDQLQGETDELDRRMDTIINDPGEGKDAELVDVRTPASGYTPEGPIDSAGGMTRDMQRQFVAHQDETITQVINIKTAYGAGQGGDDGQIINDIMTELGHAPATLIVPKGNYKLKSTVRINKNLKNIIFYEGSIFTINDDIDGFVIAGDRCILDGARIKSPANYTKTVVTVECTDGHRWSQKIRNFNLEGTGGKGTGIKISPKNGFGLMNTLIKDGQLRFFENAIEFNWAEGGSWANGGTISDVWQDFNVNGLNFVSGKPAQWTIERFRGQYNSGYTQFHIKDIRGTLNRFVDSFLWDGMNITVHNTAKYTIIDGNMISQSSGAAKIVDNGFRTNIRAQLPSIYISSSNKYIEDKENFIGADISNRFVKDTSSGATISTYLDTGIPRVVCAKLSTGATLDAKAALTMGGKLLFQRYNESVVSWKFRIPNISKAVVRMGFKSLANPSTYSSHWGLENDGANFKAFSGQGSLASQISIVADTAWHAVQIIKISESRVLFHIDEQFVGELTPVAADSELFFEIQTKEAKNKDLFIADVYMRIGVY